MNGLKSRSCCFSGHRRLPEGQRAAVIAKTEAEVSLRQ
jgi:L-ribulose-5-phosphate 3-epimerase UlaE